MFYRRDCMYKKNAFGNPDGSRTDIEDMMAEFIKFDGTSFTSGVALEDDLKVRVIVGAKGSGKTVYLRRMRAILSENDSVYVNDIEQEVPSTDLIIRFCQMFPDTELTEQWMYVWKFAIIRTVVSNILHNHKWNSDSNIDVEPLKKYTNILFPEYKTPMSVYAEARHILSSYTTKNEFAKYKNKREWDELEYILSEMLKCLPPIYFFIDSVDEEYGHAPMYWLRCQKGLFYRVMRMLRENIYGNKLHIIISIRDNVFSSVLQSEHQTRYINEDHIRILNWDYSTIEYFFKSKIDALNPCYFLNPPQSKEDKCVNRWLGIDTIYNTQRQIEEPLLDYILRHTRLLPRDVIIVGNSLAQIKREIFEEADYDIQLIIREKVSKSARTFGNELLQICANQIINNEMPKGAVQKNYSEVYTSIKEYTYSVAQDIKSILLEFNSDRFTWDELLLIDLQARQRIGESCHLLDVLWQNSALGYLNVGPNGREEIFFIDANYEDFLLPKKKAQYLLRSCLIDAIGISPEKWDNSPVIGGYRRQKNNKVRKTL